MRPKTKDGRDESQSGYSRRNFLLTGFLAASSLGPEHLLIQKMYSNPGMDHKRAKNNWDCKLILDQNRKVTGGSEADLLTAISNGADMRIYTEFHHNEHIDTNSPSNELIKEVADFRVTYVIDGRWVAGIINLRQPIELPVGFGPRPSMSFFLYNQNGLQAIARPYLDGRKPTSRRKGPSPLDDHSKMPKYHQFDAWDSGTNAPSHNFVYDFNVFKFWVCNDWEEVYAHDEEGRPVRGSVEALEAAFQDGREVKVAIRDLCSDLAGSEDEKLPHEVFVHCGSAYYYTGQKLFMCASHPVVRVAPRIPVKYKSDEWDFGWLMPRSDGHVARWLVNQYTLEFSKSSRKHAMRWFVR